MCINRPGTGGPRVGGGGGPGGAPRRVAGDTRPARGRQRGNGDEEHRTHTASVAGRRAMSRLGIEGFEQLVPEDIPKTATVLVLVPPAEEKDQLAAQFLLEGLKNGDAAIVLESDAGIRDLVRRLGNMGVDAEKAASAGRFIPLDWAKVATGKNGAPSGLPAVE